MSLNFSQLQATSPRFSNTNFSIGKKEVNTADCIAGHSKVLHIFRTPHLEDAVWRLGWARAAPARAPLLLAASPFTFTAPRGPSLAVTAGRAPGGWLGLAPAYPASGLLTALQPCAAPRNPPRDTEGAGVGNRRGRGRAGSSRRRRPGAANAPTPPPSDTAGAPGPRGLVCTDVTFENPGSRCRRPRRGQSSGARRRHAPPLAANAGNHRPSPRPPHCWRQVSPTCHVWPYWGLRAAGRLLDDTKGKPILTFESDSLQAAGTGRETPRSERATSGSFRPGHQGGRAPLNPHQTSEPLPFKLKSLQVLLKCSPELAAAGVRLPARGARAPRLLAPPAPETPAPAGLAAASRDRARARGRVGWAWKPTAELWVFPFP
nr:uncharacterized protein LOC116149609 [Camelus dromedarius]